MEEVDLPSASGLPDKGGAAVLAVLRYLRCPCLTRALVHQAWRADHFEPLDVVIGVTAPASGFTAHAWLDDPHGAPDGIGFEPLHRLSPRPRRSIQEA